MAKRTVIETLVVELTTDNSRFNQGMKSLQKSISSAGSSLANFGKKFTRFALAAFTAIGFAAGKLAKEYDMAMNRVKAVTQSTIEQMEALSKQARYLGRTTARSARQIAEGMETLGLAGFSTDEIQQSIAAVTSLSIISQQEMGKSAQDAANIMAQFGVAADDLDIAIDKLAATATSSNQTVEDLINGLKFAGPIAKQAGLSLSEAAAAMGILANNGIRAGIGGRALRMGILKLVAPTSQAAEEMEKLGISITDNITGEIMPFDKILTNVNASLSDLSDANRMATLRILFGTRALGPMNILLREQAIATENGSNAFSDYAGMIANSSEEIEGFEGTAAWMEYTMTRGLPGAIIYWKSALEGALLALQDIYKDTIIEIIWGMTNLLNAFSDLDEGRSVILDYLSDFSKFKEDVGNAVQYVINKLNYFVEKITGVENVVGRVTGKIREQWDNLISFLEKTFGFNLTGEMTRGAVIDIALLVAAIGPLLIIAGTLMKVFAGLMGVVQLASKSLGVMLKVFSFSMPIALLTALSALVIFKDDTGRYTQNIKDFLYSVSQGFVWIKEKIFELTAAFFNLDAGRSVFLDYITDFEKLKETALSVTDAIIGRLDIWILRLTGIKEGTATLITYLKEQFTTLVTFLEEKFDINLTEDLTQGMILDMAALGTALALLTPILVPVVAALSTFVIAIGSGLVSALGTLVTTGVPFLKTVGGALAGFLGPVGLAITAVAALTLGIGGFVIATGDDMEGLQERLSTSVNKVTKSFKKMGRFIELTLDGIVIEFKLMWFELTHGETGEAMAEFTTSLVEILGTAFSAAFELIGNLAYNFGKILGAIMEALPPVLALFATVVNTVMELIGPLLDSVFSDDNIEKIKEFFGSFTKVITDLVSIVGSLASGLAFLFDKVLKPVFKWLGEKAAPIIEPAFGVIIDVFTALFYIIGGITGALNELFKVFTSEGFDKEAFLGEVTGIGTDLKESFSEVWEGIKEVVSGVEDFFTDIWNSITEGIEKLWSDLTIGDGNTVEETFDLLWEGIKTGFSDALDWVVGIFTEWTIGDSETFMETFDSIWEGIKTGFSDALNTVKNGFANLFGGDKTIIETYTVSQKSDDGMLNTDDEQMTATREVVVHETGLIVDAFTTVKETIAGLWDGLWSGITGISTSIGDGVSDAIGGLESLFSAILAPIKEGINSFIEGMQGVINGMIAPINTAFASVSGVSIDLGVLGTISPFSSLDFSIEEADLSSWKLAQGGYVKRKPGGILANIGEGGSDEVVAPVPMLQKLFKEALESAAATMVSIIDSSALVKQAHKSIGTPATPMNGGPAGNGAPQYSFSTNNEFKIDGDYASKIRTMLDQQERDKRLRLKGFKV